MTPQEHNAYVAGFKDCQRKAVEAVEEEENIVVNPRKRIIGAIRSLAPEEKEKEGLQNNGK